MTAPRLFDPTPIEHVPTTSAIEHVPTVDRCPRCATTIHEQTVRQGALLRHGGFGATERTVTRSCPECHWFTTVEVTEESPVPHVRDTK